MNQALQMSLPKVDPNRDRPVLAWPDVECLRYFATRCTALVVLFALVYGGTNYAASFRSGYALYFNWETSTPFVPEWIYVYLSLFLMPLAPLFTVDIGGLQRVARAAATATCIAGLLFLAFPTEPLFQRFELESAHAMAFGFLYSYDQPHNLVPSLHVALSTIYTVTVVRFNTRRNGPWWLNAGMAVWFCLLVLSTLLTRQHNLVDVPAGLLLGGICYQWHDTRIRRRND